MLNKIKPHFTVRKKIAAGYGIALLFIVLISSIYYRCLLKLHSAEDQLYHSHLVLSAQANLIACLKDAETGQRGYLITGENKYLKPFNRARAEIDESLSVLVDLIQNDISRQESLKSVKQLIAQKFAELDETCDVRRTKGSDAAFKIVATDLFYF